MTPNPGNRAMQSQLCKSAAITRSGRTCGSTHYELPADRWLGHANHCWVKWIDSYEAKTIVCDGQQIIKCWSGTDGETMSGDYYGYSECVRLDMIGSSKNNFRLALGEADGDASVQANNPICTSIFSNRMLVRSLSRGRQPTNQHVKVKLKLLLF